MNKEPIIPVSWKGWDEAGITELFLTDVTFLEDFGNFKKGDVFISIFIDYTNGIIEAYDEEGEITETQRFKASPYYG